MISRNPKNSDRAGRFRSQGLLPSRCSSLGAAAPATSKMICWWVGAGEEALLDAAASMAKILRQRTAEGGEHRKRNRPC